MDREKEVREVPLDNPADVSQINIELTPQETEPIAELADNPEELRRFLEEVKAR